MIRDTQIILISIAYWIIFPIQTFIAGLSIRVLSLWGSEKTNKAATDMMIMAERIQYVQQHPLSAPDTNIKPFWVWFYNLNTNIINLNHYVIRWAIFKYLKPEQRAGSQLSWLQ